VSGHIYDPKGVGGDGRMTTSGGGMRGKAAIPDQHLRLIQKADEQKVGVWKAVLKSYLLSAI